MKIYISGSISDNPNYKKQFSDAEAKLIFLGHAVVNPADKNMGFSYKEYIDMDLVQLMHCDAIYMLDGWGNSKGALLEHAYALTVGMKIYKESDFFENES